MGLIGTLLAHTGLGFLLIGKGGGVGCWVWLFGGLSLGPLRAGAPERYRISERFLISGKWVGRGGVEFQSFRSLSRTP